MVLCCYKCGFIFSLMVATGNIKPVTNVVCKTELTTIKSGTFLVL